MTTLEKIAFELALSNLKTFRRRLLDKNTTSGKIENLQTTLVKRELDDILNPLQAIIDHK